MVKPEWGLWFILIALLPLALGVTTGRIKFNAIDWMVLVFAVTAWGGYWAAYDSATAWNKAWVLMTAALLYLSLKSQPVENLIWVSGVFFGVGVCVSFYFLLTHDFVSLPRKLEFVNRLGRWIMDIRPQVGWTPIHPNYVAGVIAVTIPFIVHPLWAAWKRDRRLPRVVLAPVVIGLGLAVFSMGMATSRGIILAVASGAGAWLLWRAGTSDGIRRRIKSEAVFPSLLLIYLCAVVAFLYLGPARSGSIFSGNYYFGDGSRAELFSRSAYLLTDYPITGGGLGAFPGLYSLYLLDIPFYNVPNSHNLFLDAAIEQGLPGGLAFLSLYLAALWTVAGAVARRRGGIFAWIVLFCLVVAMVHGMVDDYLYNGVGSVLSLFLIGLAMNGSVAGVESRRSRLDLRTAGAIALVWVLVAAVNFNPIRAAWYANLGAVQMEKVELAGFPEAGWLGQDALPALEAAETSLRSALQFDPANRTANHRLGMISMLRRDFSSATRYLGTAHAQAPDHRGIVKALGYCYVWLGDVDTAQIFLAQIPEAREELDVYVSWWQEQGRGDLSERAALALGAMDLLHTQP